MVIEVRLTDAVDTPLGLATMSFAVLPRRDGNPVIDQNESVRRMTMATEGSGLAAPLNTSVGLRVLDPGHNSGPGTVELPLADYVRNSLGALQGGMIATLIDAAAVQAVEPAIGPEVETRHRPRGRDRRPADHVPRAGPGRPDPDEGRAPRRSTLRERRLRTGSHRGARHRRRRPPGRGGARRRRGAHVSDTESAPDSHRFRQPRRGPLDRAVHRAEHARAGRADTRYRAHGRNGQRRGAPARARRQRLRRRAAHDGRQRRGPLLGSRRAPRLGRLDQPDAASHARRRSG